MANSTPFSLKNYSKFAKSSRNFFSQQEVSNYFFVYSTFNFILLFYNITKARLVLGSWHACTDVEKYLCVLCDEDHVSSHVSKYINQQKGAVVLGLILVI